MKKIRFINSAVYFFLSFFLFSCDSNEVNKKTEDISLTDDSLRKIVSKFPDSLIAKENLLQYYRDSGMYDLAIRTNIGYLQKDSFNPRLHHIQGLLYLESGDSASALKYFSKAYNLFNNPIDLAHAGAIYAEMGDNKSLICSDTLLEKYPEKSAKEAWLIRGVYYAKINQLSKALRCFDSAISVRFSYVEAYIEKAQALLNNSRMKEAIVTLEKAVTINNNLPEAYCLLGECHERLHENNSAILSYEKALMYDPENDIAKDALQRLDKQ